MVLCKFLSVSTSYIFGKHDFCFNVLGFHREREREKRMNELDFVCVFTLFRLPFPVSQKKKNEKKKEKKKRGYRYMKEDYKVHVFFLWNYKVHVGHS